MQAKYLLNILIWLFFVLPSFLLATPLSLKRIGLEQGLSQSSVYAIVQDNSGYIWLGTAEGIDIYDGYSFKHLRNIVGDNSSLSSNYVRALLASRDGNIWIGTLGGGLNRYDPKSGKFIRFQSLKNKALGIASEDIYSLYESKDGAIWIGTGDGVSVYNPEENRFQHFTHSANNPNSINEGPIRAITQTHDGTMWFGSSQSGLSSLSKGSPQFQFIQHIKDDLSSLSNNAINALYQDKKGNLWIGTEYGGLNKLNIKTKQITRYLTNSSQDNGLNDSEVTSFYEDARGGLWLGTWSGGLNYFDPINERFQSYRYSPANSKSISSDTIISLFSDRSGMLWAGTFDGGVNLINYQHADFQHYQYDPVLNNGLVDKMVWAISEDESGEIWIGTKKGLSQFNPNNGKFESYLKAGYCKDAIPTLDIRAILADQQNLWLGTAGGGLVKFNPESCETTFYLHDKTNQNTISDNNARLLLKDNHQQLWIGTRNGLNKLDLSTGKIQRYHSNSKDKSSLPHNRVRSLYQDNDGIIWVGTSGGLSRYNTSTDSFKNFSAEQGLLSENDVRGMWQDKKGIFWVATGNGLTRLDLTLNNAQFFHEKEGLPNNTLYNILADGEFLWITTNNGLSRFNRQAHSFTNFDISNGLQSNEFNINAALKSSSGYFYVGGVNGFNRFLPDALNSNTVAPILVLNAYSKLLKLTALQDKAPQKLKIAASDRNITFQVSVIHYLNPEKNKYQYQLAGFDDNWIEVEAHNKGIHYSSLPPGNYVLNIKGIASNGMISERIVTLPIRVKPEIWKTWWAYAIYLVAIFFLIYTLLQLRTKKLRNRAQQLKRSIIAQTTLLQEKNKHLDHKTNELKTLLKNQDDFYLRVAHELRTPLTLIQVPAEQLLKINSSQQAINNLNIILNATSRLKSLIDQMFVATTANKAQKTGVTTFDLKSHILSVTHIYQLVAQQKNIEYIVKPIPMAAITVNQLILESTLHNLISNAIRYTHNGGRVLVEVLLFEDWLEITVIDNGIGISKSDQNIIFNRSTRTESAKAFSINGDGIGLYTVKQDLNHCGGAIGVDSEEHKGSTFTACIPCQYSISKPTTVQTNNSSIESTLAENSVINHSTNDKPAVLVIEDDINIRHFLETILQNEFRVTFTGSAKQGISLAQKELYALILCDAMLPDGNACEITKALKKNDKTSHIPLILLTAVAEMIGHKSGENGADDYIVKPFSPDDLLQRISNVLSNHSRLQE